jgi:iron complex outermembrane receptor protein
MHLTRVLTVGIGSTLLFAGSVGAQGTSAPAQQPAKVIEKVEVVATRLPEAPHDVAASIEVITGDELRGLGARSLRDALALAAGVEIAPGGDAGPAGAVPEFWGLREFDAFLLVVDGVPWGGAFNPALSSLSLRDVERVEVLRGAAPVTFGATSFVGVIHVVHTAAAEATSYIGLHGGKFGTEGFAADVAVPSKTDWKSRFTVDTDRLGFTDDKTSFRRGHVAWRTANLQADRKTWFNVDASIVRQSPASPHVREGAALSLNTPLDANYNPVDAFINDVRFFGLFGIERAAGKAGTWATTASFTHSTKQLYRGFLTDVSNTPNNATGTRENITVNDIYVDSHMVYPARKHVRFIAGGDFLFGNGEAAGQTFTYTAPLVSAKQPNGGEPFARGADAEDRRAFTGLYTMMEWTPVERVNVSGGARLNVTYERRGETSSATHTRPAGSAGVLVKAWEQGLNHVRLFANYRDTFKPAAFDFNLAENEGLLKPETARSYEGGLKARTAGGRLDLEASGFRMDFNNLVTSATVAGLPVLQNTGKTRFKGFETAAAANLPRHVTGRVTYSFHDGRFVDFVKEFDPGVPTQLAGKRIEMSARHLFSAGLTVAPDRGVVASLVVKYTGERKLNMRNTAPAVPFTTVDVGIGYRYDLFEIRADGRNLTNRRDAVSESELGDAQYYLMPSRTFLVSLGFRFRR